MRLKLLYLLTFSLIFHAAINFAQQDTEFWFAAPEISNGDGQSPIYLRFQSYDLPAVVTVTQPANGAFVPIIVNLSAYDNDSINLTPFIASVESPAANVIATTGLKIVSTANISASYELINSNNKESFSLKGNKSLGTNFYTPFQKNWNNGVVAPATFSSIEIVATEDNTTVLITPRTAITGHVANVTFSITLNEGETYSARDMNVTAASSLAGSIVSSNKPIALTLFSGALLNGSCTSSIGDQITPTDYLGNDYIIQKGTVTGGERVYILATQNATNITITNSTTTTTLINWGETYTYTLTDDINYIETSKPVYVFHVSGFGCSLAGAQVPSLFCAGKYEQTFTRATSDSLGLIVYTRSGFEDDFEINGNASLLTASDFSVVPGTGGEFVATIKYFNTAQIPINDFNLITNSEDIFGLGILHGATGSDATYSFVSEFQSYPFVDAGVQEDTVCANVPFPLTGIVGGGSVTGSWGGSGYGSFQNGLTALDNVYIASNLDTIISPINLILSSTGPCPVQKDTLILHVEPAPIVNASADQTVCANNANVILNGAVFGGSTTGVWSTLGSGTFLPNASTLNATYIPSVADTTAGNVTLVLTSTGASNCSVVSDTMIVTITEPPVAQITVDTIWVCENNANFNLTGIVYGATSTGKWTTSGNGLFSPDNLTLNCSYTPTPSDIVSNTITIYLQSTGNGSCIASKDSVVIIFTPAPTAYAGGDILACTNEPSINLNGIIGGATSTGIWSGGSGTYTPSSSILNAGYTPTASEVSSGNVILTLTSTNNGTCLAVSDNVQITFIAPPFANFNYSDICLNDSVLFTDFSLNGFGTIGSWQWNFGDGNSSTQQNNYHTYTNAGTFNVSLIVGSDAGCYDTITQSVDVHELPIADFTYTSSCDNNIVILDFDDNSTTVTDAINYWFYDFGGQGVQSVENPSQLFIGSGNFVVTHIVNTINGCSDTIIKIINIPPKPSAGFYFSTSNGLNVGAEFEFIDTSSNAISWIWDFGNNETSTDQDPSTIYFANGTYTVTQYAIGPVGCIDSAIVSIEINTVTTEIDKLIPNAISPNGDGNNDVWKLNFIDLLNPNAEIIVINRWGQTLYHSYGYSQPFDGTYHGEPLPEGTYYYIIKISDEEIYEGALLILTAANN